MIENNSKLTKPHLSYSDMINKLYSKGLVIENEDNALRILKKYGYFGVITGYKSIFKNKNGSYILHFKIENLEALYLFDNQLRSDLLYEILKIENHIKSLISYSFCQEYGESDNYIVDINSYNYIKKHQIEIDKLINMINDIMKSNNYSYLVHQREKYQNIPIWVIMKTMTLGQVSKFYKFLPIKIKINISKEYVGIDENELENMLNILSRFRNVCAHNERLFNYRYKKGSIKDTLIHRDLSLNKNKGKNDFLSILIVLKYLLDKGDYNLYIDKLSLNIDNLLENNKIINRSKIYKEMGLIED